MNKYRIQLLLLLFGAFFGGQELSAQFFLNWEQHDVIEDVRQSGANPDFTIDASGGFHVSYWNRETDHLNYAFRSGTSGPWTIEEVEGSTLNGFTSSIEIGPNGNPYIAYFENVNGNNGVRLAERLGTGNWMVENLPDSTQYGFGYGLYGNESSEALTEQIRHSIELKFDLSGEPRISLFNSWYNINSEAACQGYYQFYELQPYFLWKTGGNWTVVRMNDYQDKNNSCFGNGPLPDGDRYGEFGTLILDNQGNQHLVTNSFYNREVILLSNSGDNVNWNVTVIDSQPNFEPTFPGFGLVYYTIEGVSGSMDKDGNFHFAYGSSIDYGNNFWPNNLTCCPYLNRYFDVGYARMDTAGNFFYHKFFPNTSLPKSVRHFTQIEAPSIDTIFMNYYDADTGIFVFNESFDSGKTWHTDTMMHVFSGVEAPFEIHGDSIFSIIYDDQRDQLFLAKKEIGTHGWQWESVTASEERGVRLDSRIKTTATDTTLYMVFDDYREQGIYYAEGTVQTGAWNGTIERIDTNFTKYHWLRLDLGPNNEPLVVYPGGPDGQLTLAVKSGGSWTYEMVDPTARAVYADIDFDGTDLHITYSDENTNGLLYASRPFSGGVWTHEIIDTTAQPTGEFPDVISDASGTPHVAYYRPLDKSYLYATRAGAANWTLEIIHRDTNLAMGRKASIEIAANGQPVVAYADEVQYRILLSERTGPNNWVRTVIDSNLAGVSPVPVELELDQFGNPWVAFNDNVGFSRIGLRKRDTTTWSSVAVSAKKRIADEFKLHVVGEDLFFVGKMNEADGWGIGVLKADRGLYVRIDPELERPKASLALYPNPVRDRAILAIDNPDSEMASISVYDLFGREMKQLLDGKLLRTGKHELEFSTDDLPAGIYLLRFSTASHSVTHRMVIQR